jgi:hypothetical protein
LRPQLIPSPAVTEPTDLALLAQWRAGDAEAGQALFETLETMDAWARGLATELRGKGRDNPR